MPKRPQTVLVVDDEPQVVTWLRRVLEPAGFTVQSAGSGQEAIAQAAEARPDLVILDVKLPDLHGHEVARELRRICERSELPILMLTGLDGPSDELLGLASGADAYLTKPCEPQDLLQRVSLLLDESRPA